MARTKLTAMKNAGSRRTITSTKITTTKKAAAISKPDQRLKKDGTPVKSHRFRPGTVALREIRRYQKSTDLLIRKLPFQRLVRETMQGFGLDWRIQANAVLLLQEAGEAFLTGLFEMSVLPQIHCKRVTLMPRDVQLAMRILAMADMPIYRDIVSTAGTMGFGSVPAIMPARAPPIEEETRSAPVVAVVPVEPRVIIKLADVVAPPEPRAAASKPETKVAKKQSKVQKAAEDVESEKPKEDETEEMSLTEDGEEEGQEEKEKEEEVKTKQPVRSTRGRPPKRIVPAED